MKSWSLMGSSVLTTRIYWVWVARCETEAIWKHLCVVSMEESVRTGGFIVVLAQNTSLAAQAWYPGLNSQRMFILATCTTSCHGQVEVVYGDQMPCICHVLGQVTNSVMLVTIRVTHACSQPGIGRNTSCMCSGRFCVTSRPAFFPRKML